MNARAVPLKARDARGDAVADVYGTRRCSMSTFVSLLTSRALPLRGTDAGRAEAVTSERPDEQDKHRELAALS